MAGMIQAAALSKRGTGDAGAEPEYSNLSELDLMRRTGESAGKESRR